MSEFQERPVPRGDPGPDGPCGRLRAEPRARCRPASEGGGAASNEPRLVHVSISGYGTGGPYTAKKAYDLLVECEAGLVSITGTEEEAGKVEIWQVVLDAIRVHGGYGYSTEFDVKRYFGDPPLMLVGEGTNEIQKIVIACQLVKRANVDPV